MLEAFPEIVLAGICIVGLGNGVCHLTRGVDVTNENIGNGCAAFHAALPAKEDTLNLIVFGNVFQIDGCAGVDNDDNLCKELAKTVDKRFFKIGEVIVAALCSAVNAFGRETAESYDCGVCKLGSRNNEFIGNFCFNNVHCGKSIVGELVAVGAELHVVNDVPSGVDLLLSENVNAFLLDVVLIEINKGGVDLDLALVFLHLEAFVDIANVGSIYVAASAAALDVFNGGFAEESNLRALCKGKSIAFVFKKNHTFACCLAGEVCMLRRSGYALSAFTKGNAGLVSESCVFFHHSKNTFLSVSLISQIIIIIIIYYNIFIVKGSI